MSHELDSDVIGLDDNELRMLASRLESVTMEDIAEVVRQTPSSWPVTDEELETAAAFSISDAYRLLLD